MDHAIEHEEKKKTAFFRLIVEQNVDAIVVVNQEGVVIFLNPSAERLFNSTAEQMVGRQFGFPISGDEPQ